MAASRPRSSPSRSAPRADSPSRSFARRETFNDSPRSRPAIGETASPRAVAEATQHVMSDASFAELGLPPSMCEVLADIGIASPFPIQDATLRDALAGRDILGRGRTGSGKTLAFALPMLARLAASSTPRKPGRPRALVLAPTRELASQIQDAMAPFAKALGLRTATVFGGVGHNPQAQALRAGLDVVIACPGRLGDHIASRQASLDAVEITVLDEADHLADLGFLPAVKKLLDMTPRHGQRMLFSATLDHGVDGIVSRYLNNPVTHSVDSAESPVSEMSHHVLHVRTDDRLPVLFDLASAPGRALVFTRTKHGAKKLTKQLIAAGVPAVELHGNLAQNARTRNLAAFSDGSASTLVATDIAARGIHVDNVNIVIHADPPLEHKAYLHRSGRTARAGASGVVVTISTDSQLQDVRQLTTKAQIRPTVSKVKVGDELLYKIAPGDRIFVEPSAVVTAPPTNMAPRPRAPRDPRQRNGPPGRSSGRPGARSGR